MILISPIKTEKAINLIELQNSLTFAVSNKANKKDVKNEVEKLFKVKVSSVKVLITSRGQKHAIVRLEKEFKADDVALKLKMVA